MQGLTKSPTGISKFVPHSTSVTDRKSSLPTGTIPVLRPERFDPLAHDVRNALSALKLYCDLLAEPGVLTTDYSHYAQELQAITDTASRLVERLAAPRRTVPKQHQNHLRGMRSPEKQEWGNVVSLAEPWPGNGVDDLCLELLSMRPLLAAIAGPCVELEIETLSCGGRTRLSKEDLTRVMLNLVRNASEAMTGRGRLRITAQYNDGLSFLEAGQIPDMHPRSIVIAVEDSGPGVPENLREEIFNTGFTTRAKGSNWPEMQRRGLGLTIVRSLIEAAGGKAQAGSSPGGGARLELELPITSGMYEIIDNCGLVADSAVKGCIECP